MIEGERKLATIRRIAKIEPIEGADRIVKATIDGWELVTQKDNYKVGDLCVYFEIDSFLSVRPEFEFLRKGCFKSTKNLGDGFRIKTIKLRGQVSQGLSLPMKEFFNHDENGYYEIRDDVGHEREDNSYKYYFKEGDDVTEYFKVQKYEKPVPANLAGTVKGNFPSFLHKTDQERVQNCYRSIENWIKYNGSDVAMITDESVIFKLETQSFDDRPSNETYFKSGDMWFLRTSVENDAVTLDNRSWFEATIKLDGSSMTVYHKDNTYGVCSRNLELKRDRSTVFWQTALDGRIVEALVTIGRNVALQGELMGPGVQGNREGFEYHKFFVFDIFDIDNDRYMTQSERLQFMDELSKLWDNEVGTHAPIIDNIDFRNFKSVDAFLKYADKPSYRNSIAEGVVFKSLVDASVSFKAINNHFLLTEED